MLDKFAYVRASVEMSKLREMLLYEPRGHAGQFGALLVEPVTPEAVTGVIFFTPSGFNAGMCGHGTIGIATALAETGVVSGALPLELVLDTGRGPVQVRVDGCDGIVESVASRNTQLSLPKRHNSERSGSR
jgi:proline racemase